VQAEKKRGSGGYRAEGGVENTHHRQVKHGCAPGPLSLCADGDVELDCLGLLPPLSPVGSCLLHWPTTRVCAQPLVRTRHNLSNRFSLMEGCLLLGVCRVLWQVTIRKHAIPAGGAWRPLSHTSGQSLGLSIVTGYLCSSPAAASNTGTANQTSLHPALPVP
jgi:hypothetical protein